MSQHSSESATRVLRQFRIIFNAVRTHFREVERTAGIGGAQLWALAVISRSPGLGVTELASALDVHQSTASNLVRALLSRQLITTTPGTMDRRSVMLHVAEAGIQLLASAPAPFSGILPEALAHMDTDVLARLEGDLATLIAALASGDEASRVPLAEI